MARALARKISFDDARSYRQLWPNAIGVTAIAAVNGPAGYRRRYEQTRRMLADGDARLEEVAVARRSRVANKRPRRKASKTTSAKRKPTKRRKRAAPKGRAAKVRRPSSVHSVFDTVIASKRERLTPAQAKKAKAAMKKTDRKLRAVKKAEKQLAAAKRSARSAVAGARKAGVKVKKKAKRAPVRKKGAVRKRLTPKARAARQRRQYQTRYKRMMSRETLRKPRRMGPYTAVRARIGGVGSRQTYLYETASGALRRIPDWAVMGFDSLADYKDHWSGEYSGEVSPYSMTDKDSGKRIPLSWREWIGLKRAKTEKARERAAAQIMKGRGAFVPNRRRKRRTRALTYKEWEKQTMKSNRRRRRRKVRKSRKSRRVRRNAATAKQRAAARRNIKKAQAARRRRGGGKKVRRRVSRKTKAVRRRVASYAANRRRRKRGRRTSRKRPSTYRRNQGLMAKFKEAFKLGVSGSVGYLAHRVLTKLLAEAAFKTSDYRDVISGVIVAVPGVLVANKMAPKHGKVATVGIMISLIQSGLAVIGRSVGGKWADYLSGLGSYYTYRRHEVFPNAMQGMGEYYEPVGGLGRLTQAAAGMGQITQAPAGVGQLTQAAAGMGQLTQAAAGLSMAPGAMGEYIGTGLQGIGDYEQVMPEYTRPVPVNEGIMPDLTSAEDELNIAEAAAGVGGMGQYESLPAQSTVNPMEPWAPLNQAPDGARGGTFAGSNGIFGS